MNRPLVPVLALLLCLLSGCLSMPQGADDAKKSAVEWLTLLDGGNYEKAYDDRPPRILADGDKDRFLRFMQSRRVPLGRLKNRGLYSIVFTSKLNGAPDGSYAVLVFKASFEHKASTYERVTLTHETGDWKVSGYGFR